MLLTQELLAQMVVGLKSKNTANLRAFAVASQRARGVRLPRVRGVTVLTPTG